MLLKIQNFFFFFLYYNLYIFTYIGRQTVRHTGSTKESIRMIKHNSTNLIDFSFAQVKELIFIEATYKSRLMHSCLQKMLDPVGIAHFKSASGAKTSVKELS